MSLSREINWTELDSGPMDIWTRDLDTSLYLGLGLAGLGWKVGSSRVCVRVLLWPTS